MSETYRVVVVAVRWSVWPRHGKHQQFSDVDRAVLARYWRGVVIHVWHNVEAYWTDSIVTYIGAVYKDKLTALQRMLARSIWKCQTAFTRRLRMVSAYFVASCSIASTLSLQHRDNDIFAIRTSGFFMRYAKQCSYSKQQCQTLTSVSTWIF